MFDQKVNLKFRAWDNPMGSFVALNRDHVISYYVVEGARGEDVLTVQMSDGRSYDLAVKQLEAFVEWTT